MPPRSCAPFTRIPPSARRAPGSIRRWPRAHHAVDTGAWPRFNRLPLEASKGVGPRRSMTESRAALDQQQVQAFAQRVLGIYQGGMLTFMLALGHQSGLFEA